MVVQLRKQVTEYIEETRELANDHQYLFGLHCYVIITLLFILFTHKYAFEMMGSYATVYNKH